MKACIVFPGIGYHSDKPLLYYAKKVAKEFGYRIIEVHYSDFKGDILHNEQDRKKAILHGFNQASAFLKSFDLSQYESIMVIGKSIGTTISCMCLEEINVSKSFVLYTPIEETLDYDLSTSIIFHGTNDPWFEHTKYSAKINSRNYVYDNCNHSLELDDTIKNLEICMDVMKKTRDFIMENNCE